VTAELHVDTGSNFSTIPEAVASQLRPAATESFIHSDAFDELHVSLKLLLASVQVGPFALQDVALSAGAPAGAVLRTDVLSRFLVTLDFAGKRLFLERPVSRVPLIGATGIQLVVLGGSREGFELGLVDEGSPAAKAGLKLGDRLLVVDGHRVEHLPSIVTKRLLAGLVGTVAQLKVERGHGQLQFEFKRPSEFDQSPGALTGLRLDKMLDGPAKVVAVAQGSPAQKAGLLPGDTILTMNDIDTSKFKSGQLGNLLVQPEVTVTLRRSGEPQLLTFKLKADGARRSK